MLESRKVYRVDVNGREIKSIRERVREERPSRLMQLLYVVVVALAVLVLTGAADAKYPGHIETETYVVEDGDNLWNIAREYMDKNTYGPREIREFRDGIIELNFEAVFHDRKDGEVYPGDTLQINYWVKD